MDTAQDGGEDHSIFSAWHHERSNRIKRAHHGSFLRGGCLALPIFGYTKEPGAETVVFGGDGQTDHLMCDGARHYVC